jgi:hypothetical protein
MPLSISSIPLAYQVQTPSSKPQCRRDTTLCSGNEPTRKPFSARDQKHHVCQPPPPPSSALRVIITQERRLSRVVRLWAAAGFVSGSTRRAQGDTTCPLCCTIIHKTLCLAIRRILLVLGKASVRMTMMMMLKKWCDGKGLGRNISMRITHPTQYMSDDQSCRL